MVPVSRGIGAGVCHRLESNSVRCTIFPKTRVFGISFAVPGLSRFELTGTSKRGQTNGGGGLGKGPTDAMQFGHGTQSDDVTNRPKALFVVGHCMLSHWFTSSLHTITLYRHTDPTGRPATPHDTPRAGTMLLSEADYPPLCLDEEPCMPQTYKVSTRYSPPSRIYAILKVRSSRVSETFRNGTSNDLTRIRCRYCEIRRSARRWLYTAPRGKGRDHRDEE
ncbi:hypothetical protein ALC53_11112 [Atta colombica]|uniref:Uncharacterized protein n=1 Tax=Atta colombica TaxID=520822 RepID=A0A195B2E0_9HYME|nr:hypothetical protein ALC53_11112 [Atta colombica]